MADTENSPRQVTDYVPRAQFMGFHMRDKRWAVIVAHRRAGKTYVLRQVRVDRPQAARVEMQEAVVDAALAALISHLREFRGAR